MRQFDHILNWKLKAGSHPFPGPDGGTCINEAAVVAAGFAYRPIRQIEDMPSCFSRPICRLALYLNDNADDEERQRLLPFVTRLACADSPDVERERRAYIDARTGPFMDFDDGFKVLEGALRIGRQADEASHDVVSTRMEAVRPVAKTPMSDEDMPIFTKLKKLLA